MTTEIDTTITTDDLTRDIWEVAAERFSCDCPNRRLVVKEDKLGRTHFVMQCTQCGAATAVRKTELLQHEMNSAPRFDVDLADRWYARKNQFARQLLNAKRAASHGEFTAEAAEFMQSRTWREMRRKVLERSGGLCEGCRERPAVQVHHRNYTYRFGREMLFDLVAVCRECHEAIHDPANLRNPPPG